MPNVIQVRIFVTGTKVDCDPNPLEIQKDNSVRFQCDSPFAVHFSKATPFSKMSHRGKKDPADPTGKTKSVVTSLIPKDMSYGTYKYFVAVYQPAVPSTDPEVPEQEEQVLTADPDIIIVP